MIYHRKAQKVVFLEAVRHFLLIFGGKSLNNMGIHDISDYFLVGIHQ